MTATRLKTTQVAETRLHLLSLQCGRCALCKLPVNPSEDVLDHDHSTGAVRATLHRSCNALLGKVENSFKRFGVKNLAAWASGMPAYLQHHSVNRTGLLHPSHKSEDEKRLARNAKARKTRAARKAQ